MVSRLMMPSADACVAACAVLSDWWEVVEMVRRLLLTGLILLFIPPEAEAMRLLFAQVAVSR